MYLLRFLILTVEMYDCTILWLTWCFELQKKANNLLCFHARLSTMNLFRLVCRHKTALVIGTVCSFAVVLVFLAKCTSETLKQGHQDPPGLAPRAIALQSHPEQHNSAAASKDLSAFLVVLITTGPKYTERRSIIRSTWLAKRDSDVLAMFVVGTQGLPNEDLQNLNTEQGRHKACFYCLTCEIPTKT